MSSHSQQETEIMDSCQRINEMLQIPTEDFTLEALTHIDWYLTVLELIYPQLADRFDQIKRIENEAIAIDKLLFMLTKEEIIEEDFLQIKGQDIVQGDVESVYYVVQLLNALIQREAEDAEADENQDPEQEGEEVQDEEVQDHEQNQEQSSKNPKIHAHSYSEPQEEYSNDFQEPVDSSNNNSPNKPTIQAPPQNPKPANNDMFKNVFNHYDSQDEPSRQEERHSVLGIQNEFDDEDQEDQEAEQIRQQLSSGGKNSGNNATFGQNPSTQVPSQLVQQPSLSKPIQTSNQANIFSNSQQKPQPQLVATGYKMTQQQPKKQFPSSSSQEVNFYEQQPVKSQNENQKKVSKPSKPSKGSKQETQEEDDNEYFINPTIKKYKSDPKLSKTMGSVSKKSTTKKNFPKYTSPVPVSKQSRKLVSHPTIKKQYRKAMNPEAKRLTQEVKTQASVILKKKKQTVQVSTIVNPAGQEMERKVKELKVKLADWKKDSKLQEKRKLKASTSQAKSSIQLTKVLNWREGQLKREKEEFEKAMEMKLQVQKQAYIKKINSLLIKLQKEKELHERQQYKEHLLKENHEAGKRLTAIEHWYKDRIAMLKESNTSNRNERKLMHTGHKEILKHIEKELKRDNQKQIMAITMKYRKQEAQVENDLEELEREIIKVYKSN